MYHPAMAKIRVETTPDRHRIFLDVPPRNILDVAMLEELRDAFGGLADDRPLVVIEAAGEKAFSAGASVQDHLDDRVGRMLSAFHDALRLLYRIESVTVAKVRGACLGGGCELALACDFVLASDSSRFGQPEIALGVFPPVAAWQLSHQIAQRRGLELMLAGDPIDAAQAQRLGMVNAVFAAADFEAKSEEWLARIVRHSASSLRFAKRAFRLASAPDFEDRLIAVEKLYLEELMKTEDANEGLVAFVEKRKPRWRHR